MPLDTRIALGVQPLQLADPLAREGQVQNILAAQAQQRAAGTQQQHSQLQIDQMQRQLQQDEDYVRQMTDAIGKNGGPPNVEQAARLMATNRNPQVSQQGVTMLQSLQRLDAAKKAGIFGTPAPVIPNVGPAPGAMGSGTFGMDQNVPMFNQRNVPPLNLAAPAVNQLTPPAAAPVNQLAAAPPADAAKTLQAEYMKLSQFTDVPGVKERMDLIKEQLKELSTPRVVGRNLVTGGGKTIFTAPQDVTLSPLARLQSEFAALLPGDPRRAEYAAMIRKEINFAPSNAGQGKPPAGYRYDSSGENLEVIPGGPADKQEKLKPIPPQINTAIITNQQSIKKLEDGLKFLKDYPDAVGIKGGLPQSIVNRIDEKGIPVRAAIADIGSLVLHDRSGAAVTASEEPRLLPFIPTPSDTSKSAKEKLERMLRYAKEQQDALKGTYSEDQGYRTNPILNPSNPPTPAGGSAITAADAILARINQGRR